MAVLKICLAYVIACISVGFVWMVVVVLTSRGLGFVETVTTWGLVTLMIAGFGLLPFVILRGVMWLSQKETLLMSALFGAAMGGLLFGVAFGTWTPSDLPLIVASGAGLGCVGGAVYWRIETWLWQFWPEQSAESV